MTPQHPVRHWMALPPPIQDFNKALKRMRPGKAPGPDNIPLELLAHFGYEMRNRLMLLILKISETKTLPSDFRDATVVTIFKNGDLALVRALHDGIVGRVCHQYSLSDPFPITGGLKQGCVLAPTCFSLYTAEMLNEIPPDTPSIDLRYRLDGGVFNLARLRARSKTTMCWVRELQYADDNAHPRSDCRAPSSH
ncbi:unnamed protein product [Acanthosepion pharaonis]|uniref:Reverse transcriptase domain-containing protein n=1 Tax=Acanthosepion pharaonis TaxID=158019 RepID=A0A812E287_ACAPH|nr:unnamed protein product [Sepia pharaonis]